MLTAVSRREGADCADCWKQRADSFDDWYCYHALLLALGGLALLFDYRFGLDDQLAISLSHHRLNASTLLPSDLTETYPPATDRADPPTSWHSVWSFNEPANNKLTRLGKGYVWRVVRPLRGLGLTGDANRRRLSFPLGMNSGRLVSPSSDPPSTSRLN